MNSAAPVSPAWILVVEDQDDVRRMLVTALELEGHQVEEAANAAEGLGRMERRRYQLVLTDYAMPGGTGAWMLQEASRRGLMERSVGLIITAHPDVHKVADVEVVTKPVDLDEFLAQVRRLLATEFPERRSRLRPRPSAGSKDPNRVELVLYVNSSSPASLEAATNLDRLLRRVDPLRIFSAVIDVALEPGSSEQHPFTPALVRHYPPPRMWLVGNLRDPDVLQDLLRVCGVEAQS